MINNQEPAKPARFSVLANEEGCCIQHIEGNDTNSVQALQSMLRIIMCARNTMTVILGNLDSTPAEREKFRQFAHLAAEEDPSTIRRVEQYFGK